MPSPYPAVTISIAADKTGWLAASFRFHPGMVAIFQKLPRRTWNATDKVWEFEPSLIAIKELEGTGAHISIMPDALALWQQRGGSLREPPAPRAIDQVVDVLAALTHEQRSLAPRLALPADFKFKTAPEVSPKGEVFQLEALEHFHAMRKFYLNMDTGTGKTWEYLNAGKLASHIEQRPMAALLAGPINKVPDYKREIATHVGDEFGVYIDARGSARHWTKALARADHLLRDAGQQRKSCFVVYVCINWQALAARVKALPFGFFEIYLEDESHNSKNPNSGQGKSAFRLAKGAKYCLRGSGSPVGNLGPIDLWAQLEPLKPGLLPGTFTAHKKRYAIQEFQELPAKPGVNGGKPRKFMRTTGWQNLNELREIFAMVSYRATKDDLGLLKPIAERRYVEMTHLHRAFYEEVRKDGAVLIGKDRQMVSGHAATIMLRAQQVCSGFVGLTDMEGKPLTAPNAAGKLVKTGEVHSIGGNAKHEYIINELLPDLYNAKAGRQIVLWSYHRYALRKLVDAAKQVQIPDAVQVDGKWTFTGKQRGLRVADLWGDTEQHAKDELDERFRNHEFDLIISNPQSGGTGKEFQTADVEVFESRSFSLLLRQQAEGRLDRMGQKAQVLRIDVLFEDTIEDYVLDSLEANVDVQNLLRNKPVQLMREAMQL